MRSGWLVSGALVALACSGQSKRSGVDDAPSAGGAEMEANGGASASPEGAGGSAGGAGGTGGTGGTGGSDAGSGGDSASGGTSGGQPEGGSAGLPVRPGGFAGWEVGGAGSGAQVAGSSMGGGPLGAGGSGVACSIQEAEWEPAAWSEVTDEQTLEERFAYVQGGIVGSWRGVVTTPWTVPYEIDATFDDEGHYSARCVHRSNDCCVAFYYGTDDDTELKRYLIDDATLSGRITGLIDIIFGYDGFYEEGGWQGELSDVDVDATLDRARFDFSTSDGTGPLHFELERTKAE
jgi:hypothetical protein